MTKQKINLETKVRVELIKQGLHTAGAHYEITAEKIRRMRTISIGSGLAYTKMQSKYFNPVYFYPKGVTLLKNELGHDREWRYTLKPIVKN